MTWSDHKYKFESCEHLEFESQHIHCESFLYVPPPLPYRPTTTPWHMYIVFALSRRGNTRIDSIPKLLNDFKSLAMRNWVLSMFGVCVWEHFMDFGSMWKNTKHDTHYIVCSSNAWSWCASSSAAPHSNNHNFVCSSTCSKIRARVSRDRRENDHERAAPWVTQTLSARLRGRRKRRRHHQTSIPLLKCTEGKPTPHTYAAYQPPPPARPLHTVIHAECHVWECLFVCLCFHIVCG